MYCAFTLATYQLPKYPPGYALRAQMTWATSSWPASPVVRGLGTMTPCATVSGLAHSTSVQLLAVTDGTAAAPGGTLFWCGLDSLGSLKESTLSWKVVLCEFASSFPLRTNCTRRVHRPGALARVMPRKLRWPAFIGQLPRTCQLGFLLL